MLALLMHLMRHYQILQRYEKHLNRALVITGAVSILAFLNMGFLHYQGGYFHGLDFFNRYMTAKYFKEVGYSHLNEATIIADSEDAKFLGGVGRIRMGMDSSLHAVADAFTRQGEWRGNFSAERWQNFKEDLKFFEFKGGMKSFEGRPVNLNWWNWNNILTTDSFTESPVWLSFGYIIANIFPATNIAAMILMSFSDLLLIGVMAAMIFRSFGLKPTALFTILLCCNYAPYFSWSGNSLLEMDWLCLIIMAACFLKSGKDIEAGGLTGAAACIRPFAVVFAVPHVLKAISDFIKVTSYRRPAAPERKRGERPVSMPIPPSNASGMAWLPPYGGMTPQGAENSTLSGIKFLAGFSLSIFVLILLSFIILPNTLSAWHEYFAREIVIAKNFEIWQWGFKDIFLWEGEVRGFLAGGLRVVKGGRLEEFLPVMIILQVSAVAGLFMAGRKLSYHENFLLGGAALLFFLFSLSKIYYIFTAIFALLFAEKIEERWRMIALAALFGLNILMFVLSSFQSTELLLKFIYAAGLLGVIGYSFYAAAEETGDNEM